MPKKNIYFKFEMLILSILRYKDCYGYELTQIIKRLSDGVIDIKEGVLYPNLYKLLQAGYISSYDELVNKKVRVYYHLEENGKIYFQNIVEEYLLWEGKIDKIISCKEGDIYEQGNQ